MTNCVCRFWKCQTQSLQSVSPMFNVGGQNPSLGHTLSRQTFEFGVEEEGGVRRQRRLSNVVQVAADMGYNWVPWTPMYRETSSSDIHIPGRFQWF